MTELTKSLVRKAVKTLEEANPLKEKFAIVDGEVVYQEETMREIVRKVNSLDVKGQRKFLELLSFFSF